MLPTTIPHGHTARRLEWRFLPPHVRRLVEDRCGSPVTDAVSQGGGFTPGFASVLTCEDGSRHFVKAASAAAQKQFAASYRQEAGKLAALPADTPAPRLRWSSDEDWVVLGIEHVEARSPGRPWREDDLRACLDALEVAADVLTPPPAELRLNPLAEDLADLPACWDRLRVARPDLARHDEARALADRFLTVCGGDTVVHTDLRDDNALVRPDGTVLFCDWNWPARGAAWVDTLLMLIGPRGDGLDVETLLATRRLVRDVPAEDVDSFLALLTGYFLASAEDPVPASSPYVRDVQRWQGEVVWAWLCARRGWT